MPAGADDMLTVQEAAVVSGVGVRAVNDAIDSHVIPAGLFATDNGRRIAPEGCVVVTFYTTMQATLTRDFRIDVIDKVSDYLIANTHVAHTTHRRNRRRRPDLGGPPRRPRDRLFPPGEAAQPGATAGRWLRGRLLPGQGAPRLRRLDKGGGNPSRLTGRLEPIEPIGGRPLHPLVMPAQAGIHDLKSPAFKNNIPINRKDYCQCPLAPTTC